VPGVGRALRVLQDARQRAEADTGLGAGHILFEGFLHERNGGAVEKEGKGSARARGLGATARRGSHHAWQDVVNHGLDVGGTLGGGVRDEDGPALAGGLGELGALPDDGRQQVLGVVRLQRLQRLLGQLEGGVEGVHHDEDVVEHVVQVLLQALHRLEQQLQAVEGQEVGEHRDEQVRGGHERIQVEQAEGRGRVEDDDVVAGLHLLERVAQLELTAGHGHQRQVHRGHAQVGGDEVQVGQGGLLNHLGQGRLAHQHVLERLLVVLALVAQALGGVALAVQVDEQHRVAQLRQAPRIRGGQGRLAGAALEVEEQLAPVANGGGELLEGGAQLPHIVRGVEVLLQRPGELLGSHAEHLGNLLGGVGRSFHQEPFIPRTGGALPCLKRQSICALCEPQPPEPPGG
ncbi:hypothetical protein STIAU_5795, partial [Stigmatella aurantiaca DW4/3-1]